MRWGPLGEGGLQDKCDLTCVLKGSLGLEVGRLTGAVAVS